MIPYKLVVKIVSTVHVLALLMMMCQVLATANDDIFVDYEGNIPHASLMVGVRPEDNNFAKYSDVLKKTYLEQRTPLIHGFIEEDVRRLDFAPIELRLPDTENSLKSTRSQDLLDELIKNKDVDDTLVMKPLTFELEAPAPKMDRLKTIYFLTAMETLLGQNTQIEDAFRPGKKLTGGGKATNRFYGYQNVLENLSNPLTRAFRGAKVDDSGYFPNTFLHPAAGFTTMAYLLSSGAKPKEAFTVSLANNFLFEYVVEGTYVAPSGIDLLTTAGGSVLAYISYKYLIPKKIESIYGKINSFKEKYDVDFEPTFGPTRGKDGVAIGTKIVFKR